ncbi:MAG TPA: hydrogenase nickel incorporation protein HypB, partial [Woeseiaceae bacterium]|nr:hydrogenase nickel incorporation protein HypB [Woeseiaceae bacterium]
HMVHMALHDLDLHALDIVFIENVGNLVCPASFDLGQHRNVTLLSSPEGDDKPQKYPVMFREADLLLLTKSDLTPLLGDFVPQRAEQCLRELANDAPVIELSSRSGAGMNEWISWLERSLQLEHAKVRDDTVMHKGVGGHGGAHGRGHGRGHSHG